MRHRWLVVLFVAFSTIADAQWLNFAPPGTPQTRDGTPDLAAPAPRTADGKPDLSGTWMHEVTSVAEFKRLFGALVEEAIKVDVPGMEIGTQHKYPLNLLLDFKPDDVSMRPARAAEFKQRAATADPAGRVSTVAGFPSPDCSRSRSDRSGAQGARSSYTKRIIGISRSSAMAARSRKFDLPAFSATRLGGGRGTCSWSRPAGFNDQTALDPIGHPHSEALRVSERFRRLDFGHLDVEMTFDDPKRTRGRSRCSSAHAHRGRRYLRDVCENEKDHDT